MRAVGIIPARWASTRFPGKPLARIAGRPMLEWVVEGARRAKRLRDVLVATDDERIAEACSAFGATAVLTGPDHPTGTDRLAEVALSLDDDVVVNVQGDEPLIRGDVIDSVVAALDEDPEAPMATVVHEAEPDALDDPHRVKVVLDRRGRALYFSRSRIPAGDDSLRARGVPRAAAGTRTRIPHPGRGGGGLGKLCRRRPRRRPAGGRTARAEAPGGEAVTESLSAETVREWGERYSNWGRFGADERPAVCSRPAACPAAGWWSPARCPSINTGPRRDSPGATTPST
jgi:3-deoxy-D-manno-octulosonate cytidylyltransferase